LFSDFAIIFRHELVGTLSPIGQAALGGADAETKTSQGLGFLQAIR
jgi:hypothetical protein